MTAKCYKVSILTLVDHIIQIPTAVSMEKPASAHFYVYYVGACVVTHFITVNKT